MACNLQQKYQGRKDIIKAFHQEDIHDIKLFKTINQKKLVILLAVEMNFTADVKKWDGCETLKRKMRVTD